MQVSEEIPEQWAESLAKEGFNTLAIAYFGVEGLPKNLENIPLEYFITAIHWLQKITNNEKISIVGNSRGGQLALLLGSLFPDLFDKIVAYVPSCIVNGGFPYINKPASTYEGKPILFAKGLTNTDELLTGKEDMLTAIAQEIIPFHKNTQLDPCRLVDLCRARDKGSITDAEIAVEKITCPLLLFSGTDDQICPSTLYCDSIMYRLTKNNSPIQRTHKVYANAGNGILSPIDLPICHPIGNFWCILGGTPQANKKAREDSWQEVVSFLKKI